MKSSVFGETSREKQERQSKEVMGCRPNSVSGRTVRVKWAQPTDSAERPPHPLSAPTLRSCPFLLTSSNRLNEVRFKRAGLHLLKDTGRKHQLENWIRRGFTFQSLRNTELEKKCTYDHFVQIILEGTWYNGVNGVQ